MSDPKIAVAVYVENAGFGATFGVPIGAVMIEQYLNGKLSPAREAVASRMANTSLFSAKVYGGKKQKQEARNEKRETRSEKQETRSESHGTTHQ